MEVKTNIESNRHNNLVDRDHLMGLSNSNDVSDPNNNADDIDCSPIKKFYANKHILVTGATGFIGKVSNLL